MKLFSTPSRHFYQPRWEIKTKYLPLSNSGAYGVFHS